MSWDRGAWFAEDPRHSLKGTRAPVGGTDAPPQSMVRGWEPPHVDPHLTVSHKTHIDYSFTHSRLLKYKAGPKPDW